MKLYLIAVTFLIFQNLNRIFFRTETSPRGGQGHPVPHLPPRNLPNRTQISPAKTSDWRRPKIAGNSSSIYIQLNKTLKPKKNSMPKKVPREKIPEQKNKFGFKKIISEKIFQIQKLFRRKNIPTRKSSNLKFLNLDPKTSEKSTRKFGTKIH